MKKAIPWSNHVCNLIAGFSSVELVLVRRRLRGRAEDLKSVPSAVMSGMDFSISTRRLLNLDLVEERLK